MHLSTITTMLIDGDGVLYKMEDPMPGLNRFFDILQSRGIRWALITNNATRTLDDYGKKLTKFGIEADRNQIISSASVTALTMKKRHEPGSAFYVIGADGLHHTLQEAGFRTYTGPDAPPEPVKGVIMGLDVDITYHKLAVATLLIRSGVPFVATNPDRTFPSPYGILPGAGSLVAALVAATDVQPEIIGKPESAIFEAGLEHFGSPPHTTAMIGDRMETDILGASKLGIKTILVLSGVTQRDDLNKFEYQPDRVFDSIANIADELEAISS